IEEDVLIPLGISRKRSFFQRQNKNIISSNTDQIFSSDLSSQTKVDSTINLNLKPPIICIVPESLLKWLNESRCSRFNRIFNIDETHDQRKEEKNKIRELPIVSDAYRESVAIFDQHLLNLIYKEFDEDSTNFGNSSLNISPLCDHNYHSIADTLENLQIFNSKKRASRKY
ncbi:hypothetical protein MXB_372, partial [Myxobolus squamalis]